MAKGKIVIIDHQQSSRQQLQKFLEKHDYEVVSVADGDRGFLTTLKERPHCVILETVLPGLDGLEISAKIRKEDTLKDTKIIVHSTKSYDYDRRRAEIFGADEFIPKPLKNSQEFIDRINNLVQDDIVVEFWGGKRHNPGTGRRHSPLRRKYLMCCRRNSWSATNYF
tara:strand:- start:365 stop:865 length:501 start_codon:yes stop_codon:yes gene_type:complete